MLVLPLSNIIEPPATTEVFFAERGGGVKTPYVEDIDNKPRVNKGETLLPVPPIKKIYCYPIPSTYMDVDHLPYYYDIVYAMFDGYHTNLSHLIHFYILKLYAWFNNFRNEIS